MKPLHLEKKQFYYNQYKALYPIDEETVYCEVIEATYDEEGVELTPKTLSDGTPTFEQYLEFIVPNLDSSLVENYILEREKVDKQKYLDDTDWYVIRFAETGVAIPEYILAKRQEARDLL